MFSFTVSLNVTKYPICDDPNDDDSDDSDDDEEFTMPPPPPIPTNSTLPPEMEPNNPEVEIEEEFIGGDVAVSDEGGLESEPILEGGDASVCGSDGYSYNNTCEMAKESGQVDVAYRGVCHQDRCQFGVVRFTLHEHINCTMLQLHLTSNCTAQQWNTICVSTASTSIICTCPVLILVYCSKSAAFQVGGMILIPGHVCALCIPLQVCGSDGKTYSSVCELEGEEGERVDYEGETHSRRLI